MKSKSGQYGKAYFDGILRRQGRNVQRNRNRLELILKHQSSGRLLELGCGTGELLRMEAEHFQAEGVDISEHAIRTLQHETQLNVRWIDIEQSAFSTSTYNVMVAFNVLEHLVHPGEVIRKIQGALVDGGQLIGSVPYNAALLGRIHTALTNVFDRTHVSTFTPSRWKSLFEQAGFQKIDFFGEVMFGKSFNRYIRQGHWGWGALNLMFVCNK